MKKSLYRLTKTVKLKIKDILTLTTICLLVISHNHSWGQTWTALYDEVSTPTFFTHTNDNETVLEKFDNDNGTAYTRGELVMFRSIDDPSGANFLMVSLIDNNGHEFFGASDAYLASDLLDGRLVPVAAAYNDGHVNGQPTYIVCGYGLEKNAPAPPATSYIELWYMTFDKDLRLINAESFAITAGNFPQLNANCDIFVTDVTASYGNQQPDNIDFAFTGKICPVGQASDAFRATTIPGSRTFLCEVNTSNTGVIEGFFCPSLNTTTTVTYDNDKETFPAFINEIRTGNSQNDGYIIGGTIMSRDYTPDNYPYFITRTGYNLHQAGISNNPILNTNNNSNYSNYANQLANPLSNLVDSKLNLHEAVYDNNTESIVMAGSFAYHDNIGGSDLQGFFFDQIQAVSSPNSTPTSLTTLPSATPYYHYPNSNTWVSGPNTRGVGILVNPNDNWTTNYHIKNPIVDGIFYDYSSSNSNFHVAGKLFGEVYNRQPGGSTGNLPLVFEVDYSLVTNSGDWTTFINSNIGLFPRDMNVNNNITPGSHSLREKRFKYALSKHNQSLYKYENGRMFYFLGGLGNFPYNSNFYDQTLINKVLYDNASNSFVNNCLAYDNTLNTENFSTQAYPINNDPWANTGISTTLINSTATNVTRNDFPFSVHECGNPNYFKNSTIGSVSNSENTNRVKVWQNEDNIYWKGDYNNIKSMTIYNLNGVKIQNIPTQFFQTYTYTPNYLPSGIYLLKVSYHEGEHKILKLHY